MFVFVKLCLYLWFPVPPSGSGSGFGSGSGLGSGSNLAPERLWGCMFICLFGVFLGGELGSVRLVLFS